MALSDVLIFPSNLQVSQLVRAFFGLVEISQVFSVRRIVGHVVLFFLSLFTIEKEER